MLGKCDLGNDVAGETIAAVLLLGKGIVTGEMQPETMTHLLASERHAAFCLDLCYRFHDKYMSIHHQYCYQHLPVDCCRSAYVPTSCCWAQQSDSRYVGWQQRCSTADGYTSTKCLHAGSLPKSQQQLSHSNRECALFKWGWGAVQSIYCFVGHQYFICC